MALYHIAQQFVAVESVIGLCEYCDDVDVAHCVRNEDKLHEKVNPSEIIARTTAHSAALSGELLALNSRTGGQRMLRPATVAVVQQHVDHAACNVSDHTVALVAVCHSGFSG